MEILYRGQLDCITLDSEISVKNYLGQSIGVSLFHPFVASCGTDGLVTMTNIFPLKSNWKVIFYVFLSKFLIKCTTLNLKTVLRKTQSAVF